MALSTHIFYLLGFFFFYFFSYLVPCQLIIFLIIWNLIFEIVSARSASCPAKPIGQAALQLHHASSESGSADERAGWGVLPPRIRLDPQHPSGTLSATEQQRRNSFQLIPFVGLISLDLIDWFYFVFEALHGFFFFFRFSLCSLIECAEDQYRRQVLMIW